MTEGTIDARGLSCPEPVLLTKKAIDQLVGGTIEVLVDTVTSRENITRMAHSLSCTVDVTKSSNGDFVLSVRKG
jgi:TusA-related sulfurtransferase